MVTYNPKDWIKLIVHLHKSDTMRILLPVILLLGLITAIICFIEQNYISEYIPGNLTIFHQISGIIISLVLVFRINSAYDRWWEGRKLWGTLINNSRNLAIKLNALIPQDDKNTRKSLSALLGNYSVSLKEHLRNKSGENQLIADEAFNREAYLKSAHRPNFVARLLFEKCHTACKKYDSSGNSLLIINNNLNELTDVCGACERIKNTPIPYAYSIFIKKVVFIYVITMPVAFGLSLGYWSVLTVMVMFYAFASLELISEEIEDPFGTDDNDLPTDEISEKIKLNCNEILLS